MNAVNPFVRRLIAALNILSWVVAGLITLLWVSLLVDPNGWATVGFFAISFVYCLLAVFLSVLPSLMRHLEEQTRRSKRTLLISIAVVALVAVQIAVMFMRPIPGAC